MLKITKTQELYREPCDCGSHIQHNNGGNYHTVIMAHLVENDGDPVCVVVQNTDTRDFCLNYEALIRREDGSLVLVPTEHVDEEYEVAFRAGTARIIPLWGDPRDVLLDAAQAFLAKKATISELRAAVRKCE